jgi:hypothetical protein
LGRDSQNEVKHKGARINSSIRASASYYITIGFSQGKVSAALKPVVEKVTFNGRTNYTRAKDVAELDVSTAFVEGLERTVPLFLGWLALVTFLYFLQEPRKISESA